MSAVSGGGSEFPSVRSSRDDRLYELAGRITERDRLICRLLFDHRVLTTSQVADVAFHSLRKTQERLSVLLAFGVVDRFRPRSWSGSSPNHFTLGPAGAQVIAAERGVQPSDLGWRREVRTALATSRHLSHLVGCNGFFTALIRASRGGADFALDEWWSAARCADAWSVVVRPDAYAVWVENGFRLPFCFEYDNGTEPLARLEAKLPGYAKLARAAKHPTWVLFCFPSAAREAHARRVLIHPEVPVATATVAPGSSAEGPVWQTVGEGGPRRRLAGLGHPDRALSLVAKTKTQGPRPP
ncbi:MAG: replication-relaxation family protein [Acidimicrobiales bacterium]|nr:replication-relaxation family protein [Acidimicrobiales bacterium]